MINLMNNNTTLNHDLTNALIDNVLESTASIMYIRQATYFYLLKLNGWSLKELRFYIRERAKKASVDLSRGVFNKETQVSDYCITQKSGLFVSLEYNTNKKESMQTIKKIANIMQNNKLSYSYLKAVLIEKNPDSNTEFSEVSESAESAESDKNKNLSLDSVLNYIKTCNIKKLNLIISTAESMLQDKKESSKKQKSKKAA